MAYDIIKPLGATKASKNDAGGGVIRSEPVVGVVKNNIDPVRTGRIQVYIQDINGFDPDDSKNWVTVRYLSPFYGRTVGSGPNTGYGTYTQNPISYGEWHSPPDIGTQVICIFVNGDINYGYYIGCIPEPEALHMVPAIGASESKVVLNAGESESLAGSTQLPVTNLNSNNTTLSEGSDFLNAPKSVHSYMASTLAQQGLIRDNVRGPITSSAQRESPSRVGWGVSTPGRPIYEGGLTDKNVVDATLKPGESNETKIISRRAGHTFVMDDGDLVGKDQLVRLRSSLGHQILMSDDGQCLFIIHANGQSWIELGKEGTIDMYATNSVNIRTQGDLNLHADNNVNINADKNLNIAAKESININSDKELITRAGTSIKTQSLENYTVKAGGKLSMDGAGEVSIASAGPTYVNGSKVNLNTGSTSLTPPEVKPIPAIAHTDTLFDKTKGFAPAPGKLLSIVSRAPAHFPWANAGQGVDVKTSISSSDSLPSDPSPDVSAATAASPATPDNPPSVATNATVPDVGAASAALDSSTTASMVGAVAKEASALSPVAIATGSSIVDGVPKIGQLAQTAVQMATSGTIKPGSQTLINGLVKSGLSVAGAMTNNLFTGNQGVNSLSDFVNNTTAQVKSMVTNITSSQNQLTKTGVISGNESPTAIAGIVLSGVQNGIKATTDFVKGVGNTVSNLFSGSTPPGNNIAQSISLGNFASKLASSVTGGLGSIAGSITNTISGLVAQAKGVAAGAFAAITNAYKSFTPNVPQDLTAIAKNTNTENSPSPDIQKIGSTDVVDVAKNAVNSATNLAVANTGLQGLAGGQKAIASIVNKGTSALSNIPGTSALGLKIKDVTASAMNGINPDSLTAGVGDLTKGLTGMLGDAKNNPLASLALSGLPADAASQLNSAINSLSTGGPVQIKLPTVAVNTTDRTEVTSQVTNILGNSKIPAPEYAPPSDIAKQEQTLTTYEAQLQQIQAEYDAQFLVSEAAKQEYFSALNNLPAGDSNVASLKQKFEAEYKKYVAIGEKLA